MIIILGGVIWVALDQEIVGWRIDYFCTSQILSTKLKSSNIHSEILGSDHCPVSIDIDF